MPADIELLKQQHDIEALVAALLGDTFEVRHKAIQALAELGDARSVDLLAAALRAERRDVRWTAVKALGQLRDPRAKTALLVALNDESAIVSAAAAEALQRLGELAESQPELDNQAASKRLAPIQIDATSPTSQAQLAPSQAEPSPAQPISAGIPTGGATAKKLNRPIWLKMIALIVGGCLLLAGGCAFLLVVRTLGGHQIPSNAQAPTPTIGRSTVAPAAAAAPSATTHATTPIPATPTVLPKTRLDIDSLPEGSEVYVASLSELGIKLQDSSDQDATVRGLLGMRRLNDRDTFAALGVVNDKYRRGSTPLSLPLKPGNYVVFLAAPAAAQVPQGRDLFDWLERDFTHGTTMEGLSNQRIGRTYLIEIIADETNYLTMPWQRKGASLDEIERIYPPEETFPINESEIRTKLDNAIPAADIPKVLRLLRKGRKVIYRQGKQLLTIELEPTTGAIWAFLGYKED